MTKVFRVLAFIIAGLIVVQAAAMAWGVAGLAIWVDEGNDFTSEVMESDEAPFTEIAGLMIHGMNGMMVIPLLALILLIVGLLAKFPGAKAYGAAVFLLVILQVALGLFGHENAIFGGLHGMNALILFGVVIMAGMRAKDVPTATTKDDRTMVNA